ncbi:MAG: prepilin peptidase [Patescibacteria group bacterium]
MFYNIIVFIFGLIIGSFLNCVIYRLEKREKLTGRSYCPNCNHTLSWPDLAPVFSFIFLQGKCRYCGKKISMQYPIVEIATGIIFLLIFNYQFPIINQLSIYKLSSLISLIFLFYIAGSLIVIFFYDLKHLIIPDKILFPAIAVSFIYRVLDFKNLDLFKISDLGFRISTPLINYTLAAFLASGFFLAIYLLSRGNWMGFGDVKLAVLLGLLLGFPNVLAGLFLAFFFGAIIGLIIILLKKGGLKSQLPFAPFLILGSFIALFWGQEIVRWHQSIFLLI